ncbi:MULTISPECIES: TPM domain-containing protein [Pelistega]|uniref:TPM domain-containing protein n=1 Tax=Pelistega TaxID=106146 RepID=UPI00138AD623|nr:MULTISPECIES: TPM domain-containing protein [Pelistega]
MAASAEVAADQVAVEVPQVAGNLLTKIGLGHWHGSYLHRKYFTTEVVNSLTKRIEASEDRHAGELVLAIETHAPVAGLVSSERALEIFGRLKVWDTPFRTGVLLYINLSLHTIEIIADNGVVVDDAEWQKVCAKLSQSFSQKQFEQGLLAAIDEIESLLAISCGDLPINAQNALPNEPVIF